MMSEEKKGPVEVLRGLQTMLKESKSSEAGKLALLMEKSPEKVTSRTAWMTAGKMREATRVINWLEDEAKDYLL